MTTPLHRTERTAVRRLPKRGSYDRDVLNAILDEGLVCHVGFVADGHPVVIPTAYARVGDELRELSAAQTASLRSAAGELGREGGGLERLPVGAWVTDAEVSEEGDVDRVRGQLDIVETVNGLGDLARGFGVELARIEGASADQLREATRSTLFEVHTGKDDRLLRLLRIEADFGFEAPPELRSALGELVGAKVAFRLGIEGPNREVRVADPAR
jgi:hypothetical protein